MFLLLINICLILLWLVFLRANNFTNLRLCFVKAAVSTFALIAFNTEILSLINGLNSRNVICLWLAENFCFFGLLLLQNRRDTADLRRLLPAGFFLRIKEKVSPHKPFIIILSVIYAAIFLIAVVSPPNTVDSQTYHMARVANWIQWANVDFYPTSTLRQLYSNPLAEYGILHISLLSGSDRFVNLLQFGCLVGCGIAVSLIVREFNQNGATQITGMLFTATIPMAILQASSTQNDLVVSFLVLCFFLFYLRASQSSSTGDLLFSAVALGLAFLAKGTAYIYCASIGIVIFASVFFSRARSGKKLSFFKQSLVVVIIAVSLNSIQYIRNYQLFGSPIATGDESYSNQNPTPKMMAANVVRNYAVHLGMVLEEPSNWVYDATAVLVGDELNNPDSSFLEINFAVRYSDHEDSTGNFIHILLLTICLLLAFWYKGEDREKVFITAFIIIGGFILFSCLLKWNPWLSRLHTPFFMFGCAVIVTVLSKFSENIKNFVLGLCLLSGMIALLIGEPRSIFSVIDSFSNNTPRENQYFANRPELADVYSEAVAVIKENNPQEVGLMMENDYRKYNFGDWEYPVWILLKEDFAQKPLIRHVGLTNISKSLDTNASLPEWIITAGKENAIGGVQYDEFWNKEPLRVLRKRIN